MIDALMVSVEEYLEQSAVWEAKWGKWLTVSKELRPADMNSKPEPPAPLVLWRQCSDYKTLLVAGGLLDQPYWMWTLVNTCGVAVSNFEYKKEKRDEINRGNNQ